VGCGITEDEAGCLLDGNPFSNGERKVIGGMDGDDPGNRNPGKRHSAVVGDGDAADVHAPLDGDGDVGADIIVLPFSLARVGEQAG